MVSTSFSEALRLAANEEDSVSRRAKQALDLLPLLWISCWILLAAQGDPLLSPIAARLRRLFTRFLMDPKNSGDAAKEEKVL